MQQCSSGGYNFEDDAEFQQLLSLVPSLSLSLLQCSELNRFLQQQQQQMPPPPQQLQQQQQQSHGILDIGPARAAMPAAAPVMVNTCHAVAYSSAAQTAEAAVADNTWAIPAPAAAAADLGPFVVSQQQQQQHQQQLQLQAQRTMPFMTNHHQQQQQMQLQAPVAAPCSFLARQGTSSTSSGQLQTVATHYSSMRCDSTTITTGIPAEQNFNNFAPAAACAGMPDTATTQQQQQSGSWVGSVQSAWAFGGGLSQAPTGSFDCFGLAAASAAATSSSAAAAAAAGWPAAAASAGVLDSPWIEMAMLQHEPSGMQQQQPVCSSRKRSFSQLDCYVASSTDLSMLLSCSV
jgi:hypothetical protein